MRVKHGVEVPDDAATSIVPVGLGLQHPHDDGSGTVLLPYFIKMHKVASSTVASLFNCVSVESPELYHGTLQRCTEGAHLHRRGFLIFFL